MPPLRNLKSVTFCYQLPPLLKRTSFASCTSSKLLHATSSANKASPFVEFFGVACDIYVTECDINTRPQIVNKLTRKFLTYPILSDTLFIGNDPLTYNQGGQYVGCTKCHRGVGKRASG